MKYNAAHEDVLDMPSYSTSCQSSWVSIYINTIAVSSVTRREATMFDESLTVWRGDGDRASECNAAQWRRI